MKKPLDENKSWLRNIQGVLLGFGMSGANFMLFLWGIIELFCWIFGIDFSFEDTWLFYILLGFIASFLLGWCISIVEAIIVIPIAWFCFIASITIQLWDKIKKNNYDR